jgi:trigger factor
LKVTSEKLPESQVQLNVEVDSEAVTEAMDKAYRRLVGRINVPGFRRGKAPRNMVERMIGPDALYEEALEGLVPQVYREALKEADINPVDEPQIEVTQQEPLILKFIVPVRPVVELPEYKAVRVPKTEAAVSDSDVDAALQQIREQKAEWVAIDRPAKLNDQVKIDVVGWIGAAPGGASQLVSTGGAPLVESETVIDSKDVKIWVSSENKSPEPGFAEKLEGIKAGETREFSLTMPEDFPEEKYANKDISFKVTAHEVEEERLPELNDEFAKSVGADFATFDDFKVGLKKDMQERAEAQAQQQYEDTVIRTVVDQAQLELPPALINRELDRMIKRTSDRMQMQGMALDQYLKIVGKTEEQLREEFREDAIRNLRTMFVLDKIADNEHVEVSDEDINKRIDEMAASFGEQAEQVAQMLKERDRREDIEFELRNQKTVDLLTGIASQTEETGAQKKTKAKSKSEPEA